MLNRVGWAAAAAALALTALAASPAHATGVSLQGNAGDDSMQATSGRGQVQIEGDAGNDTMDAGSAGGGSLLIAGDGDDKLISGRHSGADILEGGPGADVFSLENDHKNDSIVCGPGDDQIIGAVFGQDFARDGCPPVDAIRFASRGRAVLAGARSTASLTAHVHVAVILTQVQLVKVAAGGAQTVLASARRIRLTRSGTLRLRLSAAGRAALGHSGAGRLLIRGTLRRADGRPISGVAMQSPAGRGERGPCPTFPAVERTLGWRRTVPGKRSVWWSTDATHLGATRSRSGPDGSSG
jgi:hypothetical protein